MTTQTRIADLVPNAGVLANVVQAKYRVHNSVIASGIAATGPEVDLLMTGGSKLQHLNFVNKVDTDQYNHSSDNYDEKGPVGKVTAAGYSALRQELNWGWAYTDLVRIVTKYDLRGGLTAAIPLYWNEVGEKICVASMYGAIASDSDLTIGDGTDELSLDFLIDAGTAFDEPVTNLVVNRKGKARLMKMNINAYRVAGETNLLGLDNFGGYNVIESKFVGDNEMLIVGNGAVAFASGLVPGEIGAEIGRDINAGNGGGGEILRIRNSIVTAPQGFSYRATKTVNTAQVLNEKPDNAVLRDAASWLRTADPEFIAMRRVLFAAA